MRFKRSMLRKKPFVVLKSGLKSSRIKKSFRGFGGFFAKIGHLKIKPEGTPPRNSRGVFRLRNPYLGRANNYYG